MASLSSPTSMSELDAVNLMLRNIGESAVSSLGATAKPTAQKAKDMLAEESVNLQSGGYNFNKEVELKLLPDINKEIRLPASILSFHPTGYSAGMVLQQNEDNRLYDAAESTYKFKDPVTIQAVLGRPFSSLPQPVRWFITVSAALRFANSENPGGAALRITVSDVEEAKVRFEKYDQRLRRGGLRVHNPHVKRLRGNR